MPRASPRVAARRHHPSSSLPESGHHPAGSLPGGIIPPGSLPSRGTRGQGTPGTGFCSRSRWAQSRKRRLVVPSSPNFPSPPSLQHRVGASGAGEGGCSSLSVQGGLWWVASARVGTHQTSPACGEPARMRTASQHPHPPGASTPVFLKAAAAIVPVRGHHCCRGSGGPAVHPAVTPCWAGTGTSLGGQDED